MKHIFSPYRVCPLGAHVDHQHGLVTGFAIDKGVDLWYDATSDGEVRLESRTFEGTVEFSVLTPSLVKQGNWGDYARGAKYALQKRFVLKKGIKGMIRGSLPVGGLSSSAAFEVLFGTIINHLTEAGLSALEIAQLGQYAENVYFGKPCGLLDQAASSLGGVITIDFADEKAPQVERLDLDLAGFGYALCIVDSGADHADLTDEYAAIPGELRTVNAHFGKTHLREVPEEDFYAALPELRREAGDRAVLRAMHIYEENRRVTEQVAALKRGDFDRFLELVKASGRSSWMYLQNVIPAGYKTHQDLAVSLALAEKLLAGRGACRVHGGGFAGTIQAFVPLDALDAFRSGMDAVLGEGSCHILSIRSAGGILLEEL